jgi:hypothetical protein
LTDAANWPELQNRVLFVCLILAALATVFGQFTDGLVKQFNRVHYRLGMRARGYWTVISAHLLALIPSLVRGLVVVGFFLLAMAVTRPRLVNVPDFKRSELLVIPLAIGLAGLVKLFYRRARIPLFAAGAVLSGVLWVFWK